MKIKIWLFSSFGIMLGLGFFPSYAKQIKASAQVFSPKAAPNRDGNDSISSKLVAVLLSPEQMTMKTREKLKLTLFVKNTGTDPIRLDTYEEADEILLSFKTSKGVPVGNIEVFEHYRLAKRLGRNPSDEVRLAPREQYKIEFVVNPQRIVLPLGKYVVQAKFTRPARDGLWSGTVESNSIDVTCNP